MHGMFPVPENLLNLDFLAVLVRRHILATDTDSAPRDAKQD